MVSQNIRDARDEAGLTQQEVANKTGFKVSFVARLETIPQNISLNTLEIIASALNKSPDQFLQPSTELVVGKKGVQIFEEAMGMLRTLERMVVISKDD